MIEHVYGRTAETRGVDAVIVATDDPRIADVVERFGGKVVMTSPAHRTGTDRIAEAARDLSCDIVVNVQGDLPLIEPAMLAELIAPLTSDVALSMSTLCRAAEPGELENPNVVKVVRDRVGNALYFSRAPIPYVRDGGPNGKGGPPKGGPYEGGPYVHIGLYGYRRDFLMTFAALPQTPLEQAESLEQLRALEYGYRISTVETRYESIEVDTPEDLERVRRHLTTAART